MQFIKLHASALQGRDVILSDTCRHLLFTSIHLYDDAAAAASATSARHTWPTSHAAATQVQTERLRTSCLALLLETLCATLLEISSHFGKCTIKALTEV